MEKSKYAMKGLESKGCESSDAAIRSSRILKEYPEPAAKRLKIFNEFIMGPKGYLIPKYETHRLIVTGYDTCLPKDVVRTALVEHFSSCGEIVHLIVPGTDGVLKKTCLVYIRGPDALEKAMELNNGGCKCHVQGCKIIVDKVMIRSPDTEPYISWPSRWNPSQEGQDPEPFTCPVPFKGGFLDPGIADGFLPKKDRTKA